ncbi:MAG: acyl-CoA dehydrogenase family protein [Gemmatimonadales bacterium]
MDFSLSPAQLELRDAVREFARRELAGNDGEHFSRERWRACAEFGLLGLHVPEQFGGSAHDLLTTMIAMEALGYGCNDQGFMFSIHAHLWAVVSPLLTFGTPEQQERLIPALLDGRWIGAHGMSEPDSGSDAFSLRTRAEKTGDGYVLNGVKTFVTNAPIADVFVLFATVNPKRGRWGVTAFVLEKGTPGLAVTAPFKKLGLHSSPMSEVVLTDCRVPATARLGAEGQGAAIFLDSMGWERACILGSQIGRLDRQLETCINYAKQRRQFGQPLGNFQLVAAKLADMRVRLETARLLLYRSAWEKAREGDVALYSAMAKLYVSEVAVASSLDAIQLHGGYGYMEEFEVARDLRDAVGGTLYSGTSEIQRLLIARALGVTPS